MRQTYKLCMSGWWWWWSHFANKLWQTCSHIWVVVGSVSCRIGQANPRRDMLAHPGGGGLSFLQENPSKFFKIPFLRFPLASAT